MRLTITVWLFCAGLFTAALAVEPAVESGRLSMELHPWYGSAALMKVGGIHGAVSRTNF